MPYQILFVCTGNICRSPMAEAVARHKIEEKGLKDRIVVDSAGTHAYHVGEAPDYRTLKLCAEKGIKTEGLLARQIRPADFERFDLILGMDQGHISHMERVAHPDFHSKISLMMEYAELGSLEVPDPYYGGMEGFYEVFDMLDRALDPLFSDVLAK